jgi:hypothetical protein
MQPLKSGLRGKETEMEKGSKHTKETRRKLALSRLGKKHNKKTKALISAQQKGRAHPPTSEETKAKIAATLTGTKASAETRAKMKATWARKQLEGYTISAEHREKIRTAKLGVPRSPEARAAMRAGNVGRPPRKISDDERLAMSLRMLGFKHSTETKEKMRQVKLKNPTRYWLGKDRGPMPEQTRAALVKANTGRKRTLEWTAKIVAKTTGKKRSPEVCEKFREIATKAMTPEMRLRISASRKGKYTGPENHQWGKTPAHGKRVLYNGALFRGSYEPRFAKALDALGIRWNYEPDRFDLGTCTYVPDFYLRDFDTYCEVKGWLGPNSEKKLSLFAKLFPSTNLIVIMQEELKDAERHAGLRL